LNDVTARLPALVELLRTFPAESVILDGEVLGVAVTEVESGSPRDGDGGRPDLFQTTASRFSRHDGAGAGLEVRFFDCLHLDGTDLLDRPLTERRAALERVAGEWCIPATLTADDGVAASVLETALAAGHEGVMVKRADSVYEAGRRG